MSGRPELMGSAEIAALLGVSRQRVLKLAQEPGFPRPLAALTMGKVWDGQQIRKWAAGYAPARPTRSAADDKTSKRVR